MPTFRPHAECGGCAVSRARNCRNIKSDLLLIDIHKREAYAPSFKVSDHDQEPQVPRSIISLVVHIPGDYVYGPVLGVAFTRIYQHEYQPLTSSLRGRDGSSLGHEYIALGRMRLWAVTLLPLLSAHSK
jgi:hypothetical protein